MTNDVQNINRANAIQRKIWRILCKNNSNGGMQPDAEENNDKVILANSERSVDPREIVREMINVMDLLENMKRVVENIDDFSARNELRGTIFDLELARQDIIDEIRDRINDKTPAKDKPLAADSTFLIVEGGDIDDIEEWA